MPIAIPGEDERLAVAGIADLFHLTKLELRPAGAPIVGDGIASGTRSRPGARSCCAHRPLLPPRADRSATGSRWTFATGAYSVIAIAGPEAGTVLRRLTHIHHYPSGGEIAHVQGHVLECKGGYWVLCAQELGQYVWEVAVDRASALGGGPVGVDALELGAPDERHFPPQGDPEEATRPVEEALTTSSSSAAARTASLPPITWRFTMASPTAAILEKSYIGSGAAGRNTTIIRSNYRTPEGAAFYSESVKLYEKLSVDLDFNMMFSQHGHFTLAHSDRSLVVQNERGEVNKLLGIDSRVIDRQEVKRLCPQIHIGEA